MVNPIYTKDSLIANRSVRNIVIILFYNLILSIFGFAFLLGETREAWVSGSMNYSEMLNLYIIFSTVELALLLLVVPGLSAVSISGEREQHTLDMLLVSEMRPMRILLGKLLSVLEMVALMIISNCPVMIMTLAYGGIRVREVLFLQLSLLLITFTIACYSLFFSVLFRSSIVSVVASYVYTAFTSVGSFCITYLISFFDISDHSVYHLVFQRIVYLLLVNPIVSYYVQMNRQIGDMSAVSQLLSLFDASSLSEDYLIRNWFAFSMFIQVGLAMLALIAAAYFLEPIHRRILRDI